MVWRRITAPGVCQNRTRPVCCLAMLTRAARWFDRTILELGREFRLSYLPPLMVYVAYGVSGLTAM